VDDRSSPQARRLPDAKRPGPVAPIRDAARRGFIFREEQTMAETTGPPRRDTHEQNAEALRQTRRELDPDIARLADTADGIEALEQPTLPDHAGGGCVVPATDRDASARAAESP
jgi:hypothetical protein